MMECKKTGKGKYQVEFERGYPLNSKTRLDIDLNLMGKHLDGVRKHLYENEELNTMKAIVLADQDYIAELQAENKALKEDKKALLILQDRECELRDKLQDENQALRDAIDDFFGWFDENNHTTSCDLPKSFGPCSCGMDKIIKKFKLLSKEK